jgi:hypothetical protein
MRSITSGFFVFLIGVHGICKGLLDLAMNQQINVLSLTGSHHRRSISQKLLVKSSEAIRGVERFARGTVHYIVARTVEESSSGE